MRAQRRTSRHTRKAKCELLVLSSSFSSSHVMLSSSSTGKIIRKEWGLEMQETIPAHSGHTTVNTTRTTACHRIVDRIVDPLDPTRGAVCRPLPTHDFHRRAPFASGGFRSSALGSAGGLAGGLTSMIARNRARAHSSSRLPPQARQSSCTTVLYPRGRAGMATANKASQDPSPAPRTRAPASACGHM